MAKNDFTYEFETSKSAGEVFDLLTEIPKWWSGLHEETITGKSGRLGDEFSFTAGRGMHHTEQQVVELVPGKKLVWLVTDAKLTFVENTGEWKGTKFGFYLAPANGKTHVTFIHDGLVPEVECFEQCSAGWTGYLKQLENRLNG